MPQVLENGKTPEEWVEVFDARGIPLSARTIRAEARRLGACKMLGKAMILLPEHIDRLFQEPPPRKSPKRSDYRPANSQQAALEHLRRRQRQVKPSVPALPPAPSEWRRRRVPSLADQKEAERIQEKRFEEKFLSKRKQTPPES